MNAARIRLLNISRIFHTLRLKPDSSQRELVHSTGIDQATVSAVVNQLEEVKLLERSTKPNRGRVGRPEDALRIARDAGLFVGASLEPNIISLIATTLDGNPIMKKKVTGSHDIARALKNLRKGFRELVGEVGSSTGRVRGIGVGVPAIMGNDGNLIYAPNLDWHDVPILSLLQEDFDVPIYADNDTNAAALAEKLFGSCRHVTDFIYLAGQSGIGAGLFLGGGLYRGASGYGGEIGHLKVVPDGRLCGCGQRGCLEAYASEASVLRRLAEADVFLPDISAVVEAAKGSNETVLEILSETGEFLGATIADLINLANPQLVVLGGALAVAASYLLPVIEQSVRSRALAAPRRDARVIVSPLGAESVPMGGIALALEGFLAEPGWFAASGEGEKSGQGLSL